MSGEDNSVFKGVGCMDDIDMIRVLAYSDVCFNQMGKYRM